MFRSALISLLATTAIIAHAAYAEVPAASLEGAAPPATSDDSRQLVTMPEQARALMRQDMLGHLTSLNEILGHLATNNLAAAAEVAESRMGNSSMGKHRASGMGPGRFMPLAMRNLGWGMHESVSEFAQIAKKGDVAQAYGALQKVTASCIACHYSYRTR
jgi:hypothetical protein